jgi:hypothetical protein
MAQKETVGDEERSTVSDSDHSDTRRVAPNS